MELLQLKYFLDSAESGSFSETAKKHMVPTTSVSAAVKRLENELGFRLFDRSANKITLNKHGKRLKDALQTAFFEIDAAIADISTAEDDREINLLVRAVRSDISDCIIEYNRRHTGVKFNAVFDFNERDFEKYDVIIDEKSNSYTGYSGFCLVDMQIRMKAARGYFDLPKKLKLADLQSYPFISWGESSNMHKILMNACASAGFSPRIAVQLNDKECYDKMLRAGVGIGLGRENPDEELPALQYIDVADFDERYSVFCYYNPKTCFGNVKGFVDYLRSVVKT
ncbi:MAG: LysR family transcriptional regulator [Clostridia bacterium]|nr:LysR family transcriptional regulator [Clostridia bacterium]